MYVMRELKIGIEEETKIVPNLSWGDGVFLPLPGVVERGLMNEGKGAPTGVCIISYKVF